MRLLWRRERSLSAATSAELGRSKLFHAHPSPQLSSSSSTSKRRRPIYLLILVLLACLFYYQSSSSDSYSSYNRFIPSFSSFSGHLVRPPTSPLLARNQNLPGLMLPEQDSVIQEQVQDSSNPLLPIPPIRILHVAHHFGPVSPDDFSASLTRLALLQAREPRYQVSAVIPFYSFLRPRYRNQLSLFAEIPVAVPYPPPGTPNLKSSSPISETISQTRVYRMKWPIDPTSSRDPHKPPSFHQKHAPMTIYLISPPDLTDLKSIFSTNTSHQEPRPTSSSFFPNLATSSSSSSSSSPKLEAQTEAEANALQAFYDLYFAKAATELVTALSDPLESSLFDFVTSHDQDPTRSISAPHLVHMHGARSAWTATFLRSYVDQRILPGNIPTVFTLPDQSEPELAYSVPFSTFASFFPVDQPPLHLINLQSLDNNNNKNTFYDIPLDKIPITGVSAGLGSVDAATIADSAQTVSPSPPSYYLQELIWPYLTTMSYQNRLSFIPHGPAPMLSPFDHPALTRYGLAFPNQQEENQSSSSSSSSSFTASKKLAKQKLVNTFPTLFPQSVLNAPDSVPWVLIANQDGPVFSLMSAIIDLVNNKKSLSISDKHPLGAHILIMPNHDNSSISSYSRKLVSAMASLYPQLFTLLEPPIFVNASMPPPGSSSSPSSSTSSNSPSFKSSSSSSPQSHPAQQSLSDSIQQDPSSYITTSNTQARYTIEEIEAVLGGIESAQLDEHLIWARMAADYVWNPSKSPQSPDPISTLFGSLPLDIPPQSQLALSSKSSSSSFPSSKKPSKKQKQQSSSSPSSSSVIFNPGPSSSKDTYQLIYEQTTDINHSPESYVAGNWQTWGSFLPMLDSLDNLFSSLTVSSESSLSKRVSEAASQGDSLWTSVGGAIEKYTHIYNRVLSMYPIDR